VYPSGCGVPVRLNKSHDHNRRLKQSLVVCLAVLAVGVVAWRLFPRHSVISSGSLPENPALEHSYPSLDPVAATDGYRAPAARELGRVVYPYSLIPGGIHGSEELRMVSARDAVVGARFAGFNFQRATLVRVKEPKLVYLAYRMNDQVYWTKKKVRLVAGETLITDGKITARTRCANPVSEHAQGPYSPEEPAAEKFEKPMGGQDATAALIPFPSRSEQAELFPPANPALLPVIPPVVVPPGPVAPIAAAPKGWFIPPLIPPIPGGGSSTPVIPPAVTPEPSTILLLTTGLAGIYARYRKSSKR